MSTAGKDELCFYTTDGCHLCEQALSIVQPLAARHKTELQLIDIATNEHLVAEYGLRIPVLKNLANGDELGWPFGEAEVLKMISPLLTA